MLAPGSKVTPALPGGGYENPFYGDPALVRLPEDL